MKTAISVPDALFERADRFARQTGKSRSEIFQDTLRKYLVRHAPDEITEAMDRVVESAGKSAEELVAAASAARAGAH